jgi:hypothetical protein
MIRASVAIAVALAAASAAADTFGQVGATRQGRMQFILVGASMVDNQGLTNGVNCLWPSATTVISSSDLPPRAELVQATLYLGGSLLDDRDAGLDYTDPDLDIFTPPCSPTCTGATSEVEEAEVAARAAADHTVEFQPPGADAPITVGRASNTPYVTAHYKGSPERGYVAFFVTPIDVTEEILNEGGGVLEGPYTVSGLLPDVCYGSEAVCVDPPNEPVCVTPHTNGAGSFALLLIVEDPELPLHSVAVFEGLESLLWDEQTILLTTASQISNPAAGALALYALEGDLGISSPTGAGPPCDVTEYIEVDGDEVPQQDGLCLFDDDNPRGNPFNSTINVQPASGAPPACTADPVECCRGDGLCPVTGVDIDRYNISPALVPGVNQVRATVASGGDRVALGLVVLGVDVFEPVLSEDTQVRVLNPSDPAVMQRDGEGSLLVRLAGPVVYSLAISNTGNVPATETEVRFSAPPNTSLFAGDALLLTPPDAAAPTVSETGGDHGTGEVLVTGFSVPAGEISEVRVRVWTACSAAETTIAPTVEVGSAEVASFTLESDCTSVHGNCFDVVVRGPGASGTCPGADPGGPFSVVERVLRGGGGCRSTPSTGLALLLLVAAAAWHRRGTWVVLFWIAAGASCTEEREPTPPGDQDPPPPPVESLEDLPGEACGDASMVWVTRPDESRFCIDRFEAALGAGDAGDLHQGADDTDLSTNGSTTAAARVELGQTPARVSWYQAKAACENAGKRLCTLEEWETACRGPNALVYPYGDTISDDACRGFFNYPERTPEATGSLASCESPWGVYDMSGNVEEWTATAVPRIPGSATLSDRAVRGGSYKSNSNALACIGDEFHEAPGSADEDRGFRCCADEPL